MSKIGYLSESIPKPYTKRKFLTLAIWLWLTIILIPLTKKYDPQKLIWYSKTSKGTQFVAMTNKDIVTHKTIV